jgi:hypothetical protein
LTFYTQKENKVGLWCLTSISTISQLYRGGQLYWWKETGVPGENHWPVANKGNNKITVHQAIFQRERQNSYVNKQTKSVNNRKTGKTAMALTWYRHFQRMGGLNQSTCCCIEYTPPWAGFELTTSVVIGTDCLCSCISNYLTITTKTATERQTKL